MNESNDSILHRYIERYHLTFNSRISKELLKFKESEKTNSFRLNFHILKGILSRMREELNRNWLLGSTIPNNHIIITPVSECGGYNSRGNRPCLDDYLSFFLLRQKTLSKGRN